MSNLPKQIPRRLVSIYYNLQARSQSLGIAVRGIMDKAWIAVLLSIMFFSLVAPISLSSQLGATQVIATGQVTYDRFDYLTLKYSTDFENTITWSSKGGSVWYLVLGIDNSFVFDGIYGTAWIEGYESSRLPSGVYPHSGTRCIGMSTSAGSGSGVKRAEFNILNLQKYVGDELYVSSWNYWGSDFMTLNTGAPAWGGIGDAYFTGSGYQPFGEFCLDRFYPYGENDLMYYLKDVHQNPPGGADYRSTVRPFNLASYRGAWHHIEYYVRRSTTTNGIVKYWIDGNLILDAEGFITEHSTVTSWYTTCLKLYMDAIQTNAMHVWIDDLQIYGN